MNDKSWDHLKMLTKEQIVVFLKRRYFFNAPRKYDVAFYKWDIVSQKLQIEMGEHLNSNRKKNDEYARQADLFAVEINEETDIRKKIRLLEKRGVLIKKIQDSHKQWEIINQKQEANDLFLEKIKSEVEK